MRHLCRRSQQLRVRVVQPAQKAVWMNGSHTVRSQRRIREVPQIHCQDGLSLRGQCSRQNMTIVGIEQVETLHVCLPIPHIRLWQSAVHQLECAQQALVWCSSGGDQVANTFFVDARRPTGRDDRIHAELDQQLRS